MLHYLKGVGLDPQDLKGGVLAAYITLHCMVSIGTLSNHV